MRALAQAMIATAILGLAFLGAIKTNKPREAEIRAHVEMASRNKPGRCNDCHPPYDICLPPCRE